jgi:hypothetical protein
MIKLENTTENGLPRGTIASAKANKFCQTDPCTKARGKIKKQTEKAGSFMLTETCMMDSGKTTRQAAQTSINDTGFGDKRVFQGALTVVDVSNDGHISKTGFHIEIYFY